MVRVETLAALAASSMDMVLATSVRCSLRCCLRAASACRSCGGSFFMRFLRVLERASSEQLSAWATVLLVIFLLLRSSR